MESLYLTSAVSTTQFPTEMHPETVFIGRSNCGKSSLLNALLKRKNLARTSSTPGRTAMVNFFLIKISATKQYILADLPGYGFSKTGKNLQKEWGELIPAYLKRGSISKVLFLLDVRRVLEAFERDYIQQLSKQGHSVIVVLTKSDKVSRQAVQSKKKEVLTSLSSLMFQTPTTVLATSTLKKQGLDQLRKEIFSDLV